MKSGRNLHYIVLLFISVLLVFSSLSYSQETNLQKVKSLNQEIIKLYKQGKYSEAIPIAEQALTIREKMFGPNHPDVATSLNNLATLYFSLRDYAKAEPLYKRSLTITEKALGPDHPDVADSLNILAELYASSKDYAKAEPLLKKSLVIYKKVYGPNNSDVAKSLNNLAMLYFSSGDYTKAEPLLKKSLVIREKTLGPDHLDVATSLNNLALLYKSLGDYAKAEPLYKRSLAIREKALGPEHLDVAQSQNNLAGLYMSLGDYTKAEPLLELSMVIRVRALGPDHPDVADSLNNLATLYFYLGDYAKAARLLNVSIPIYEKAFGPYHPGVATSLNILASIYLFSDDYAKAEPLYKRSLTIKEKALGPDHPDVATSLSNLASLYYTLGDYAKAEPLYKRSLTIKEKALGPDHPDVALSYNLLGSIYAALDDYRKAHDFYKKGQMIDDKLIDQVMGVTSEDQKIQFLSMKKWALYAFLSNINQNLSQNSSSKKDALNIWLKRKGVILETQKRFQEALIYSDGRKAIDTFQELSRVRRELSKLTFSKPSERGLEAYKKKKASFDAQKEELEANLSKLSQSFALKQKISKADCEKVARALPPNSALLEFARVEMFDFKAKGKEKKWKPAHYLAFVLHASNADRVGMIDLGDAKRIDETVTKFKTELSNPKDIKGEMSIKLSRSLYDLVFAPLKTELGKVKKIFVSPDGILNLFPFEVIQGTDEKYLIEDYTFNYLSAGRDVVGFGQIESKGKKALIMGDPDFDMKGDEKVSNLRKLALRDLKNNDIAKRSADMREYRFTRLPGTREEVKSIQAILGKDNADLYTDKKALEKILIREENPRILHLATHGFFLNDLDYSELMDERLNRGIQVSMNLKEAGKKVKIESPLLRSGIALAGANNTLKHGNTEKSDGIVTAEKILGLRLRGTDMVVLSACDTGIGEVKTGEGVFGLRRAFNQAGTKSLVMSMWSVPDRETKELMVEFYKNIHSGKLNRCQSLKQAALREMRVVKERYGYANPFFWGAFVFLGEP